MAFHHEARADLEAAGVARVTLEDLPCFARGQVESAFAIWTGWGRCRGDAGAEGLGAVTLEVDGVGTVETVE